MVGVTGKALDWFKSYLTSRCQSIRLGDCSSSKADLKFRVPQRSVLGLLLFTLYTTPFSSMISGHTIPHHLYAGDSQLYVSFASGFSAAALNGLQSSLAFVQSWMLTNKLNPDKTEFLLIGNDQQWNKYLSMFPIELSGVKTNPAKSARNLGVIFDKYFTFRSHICISEVCSSCFYHMWDLRRIHGHLDLDSAKVLATALVSSRLDYCKSLLHGIAALTSQGFKCVQNQRACQVTKSSA